MENDLLEKAVENYKKGRINRRELISILSPLILKIPSYLNSYDEDIKSDFYTNILSNLCSTIERYEKKENCTFKTWFIFVLKRQFKRQFKERAYKRICVKSFMSAEIEYNDSLYTSCSYISQDNNESVIDFSQFTKLERKIIELKFGFTENPNFNREMYNKIEKKRLLQVRITDLFYQILDTDKKIRETKDIIEIEKLRNKKAELLTRKRNNEDKFSRVISTPSNKWVGEQLNIAEGTVNSYLTRIRNKMKDKVKNNYDFIE